MKVKEGINIEELAGTIDMEGFWYSLTNGYLDITDVIGDEKDIQKVKDALKVLKEFEALIPIE